MTFNCSLLKSIIICHSFIISLFVTCYGDFTVELTFRLGVGIIHGTSDETRNLVKGNQVGDVWYFVDQGTFFITDNRLELVYSDRIVVLELTHT